MLCNQRQIIEQAKFTFSPLGKVFEKQIETIKDQEKKQVEAIKEHGKQLVNSDKDIHNKSHKIFDELFYERMSKINDLSRQINFNNLIYHFKDKSISSINFIGFKAPLHLCRDIFNGNTKLAKAEEDQEQFKSDLNEIPRRNPKKKSEHQIKQ